MMDYFEIRRKLVQFINESGISSYDICRVSRDLCCCRTCFFYVQHYEKGGEPVDFGHCTRTNQRKSVKPNTQSCGFWSLEARKD